MHVAAEISALDGFCDKEQQQQELGILVAYILKVGDAGDISTPYFWIFRQILG